MDKRPTYIRDAMTLKVLILYLLRRADLPVPEAELTDVTILCDEGIDYFAFSACLHDLVGSGHILANAGAYSITEKGRQNGEATENTIPLSVRIRADEAAANLARTLRRNALIEADHELRSRGGFTLRLGLADEMGKLMQLELLCGDEKSVRRMEENFRKNAERLYSAITELLLREES